MANSANRGRAERMRAASQRRRVSATGPDSERYEPGSSPRSSTRVISPQQERLDYHGAIPTAEEARSAHDAERMRKRAMGKEKRASESPRENLPGWEGTDSPGGIPNETTRRTLGSQSPNPDKSRANTERVIASRRLAAAATEGRTRTVVRAAGTTEGPGGGTASSRPGQTVMRGPRRTEASRTAEMRIGAENPNVTPGSLSEISPEERAANRRAASGRRAAGTRRRSGGGSTPDLNTVATGDTSGERVRDRSARSRARRQAKGMGVLQDTAVEAATGVADSINTKAKKTAAAKYEKAVMAKAMYDGETKPAVLETPKEVAPAEVIGTPDYHLARASEVIGHSPEHLASFLRAQGLSVEQGAKGLYDLVHRETKGQEVVTKGAPGAERQETRKKAITVVNRGGKTYYEKGTGNGTPALEALKGKVAEHVEGVKRTRRKSGVDVATEAITEAAKRASES